MYHCWLWSYAVYWLPVLCVMMVFDSNWTIHTSILQNVTCLKFYSLVILMQHINYKCGKGHLSVKILVNGNDLKNPVHMKLYYLHFIIYSPVKSPWFGRHCKSSEKEKAHWAIKIRKGKSADERKKKLIENRFCWLYAIPFIAVNELFVCCIIVTDLIQMYVW